VESLDVAVSYPSELELDALTKITDIREWVSSASRCSCSILRRVQHLDVSPFNMYSKYDLFWGTHSFKCMLWYGKTSIYHLLILISLSSFIQNTPFGMIFLFDTKYCICGYWSFMKRLTFTIDGWLWRKHDIIKYTSICTFEWIVVLQLVSGYYYSGNEAGISVSVVLINRSRPLPFMESII
jgi:hypothetical protein